ncbi:unnamed protein product [Sphagnum compactum]
MSHSPPATRVPVGFRFHPTDEELVGYYLPKKVAAKPIDLDLIRELDLYKLEPWDLQEQCKIPDANEKQTDYYFFSRKDKKYPTGNRANRATTAGFWKATGRDKAIWTKVQQLIGMRKTLVFYEGRAPHGNKTDWIMHEFRLDDGPGMPAHDDGGWVVCRVFKKTKNFKMKTEERAVSYEGQFGMMPEIMSSPEILSGGGGAAASYHPGFGPNNNPSMVPSSAACKQEMNLDSSYNAVPAAACHDSFNALHLAQLAARKGEEREDGAATAMGSSDKGMKHTYHHHHHHDHHSRASSSVKDGRGVSKSHQSYLNGKGSAAAAAAEESRKDRGREGEGLDSELFESRSRSSIREQETATNGNKGTSRREQQEVADNVKSEKKQRVENGALLSLALPDTSLSLSSGDPHGRQSLPHRHVHSHPSQAPTRTHSTGFTNSISLSHSQPFHHNPSCSLTQTSLDKTELSSGSQQISQAKEQGSHGSWQMSYGSNHANEGFLTAQDRQRSKPLYQRLLQSGNNPQILQGSLGSERLRNQGRGRVSESVDISQGSHQVAPADSSEKPFTSIRVQDIVSEPIPSMARKLQELPDSFLEGLKESLRDMLNSIEKREEFVLLQQTLAARTDLVTNTLLRAHRVQLELLVAVKTGILAFLHPDIPMTHSALVEIFLQTKCRNFACQSPLPADECDCKLCAQKAGFCNSCMCVVCSKFDFDANTCRWIGCDFCLHWCHTDCGIRMGYIAPGPSISGAAGTSEMQFHCIACEHTSELYGFVKDVFCAFAPQWKRDVLASELDCVRRIFRDSNDARGQQLCSKAEEMLLLLDAQLDPAPACSAMLNFFSDGDVGGIQSQAPSVSREGQIQPAPVSEEAVKTPPVSGRDNKTTRDTLDRARAALQTYDAELEEKRQEAAELQQEREHKKGQIEELESIVRIKQAEAKMFAVRADEARREAEGLQRIVLAKSEKIEQEYASKLTKLHFEEAEDRCRKGHEAVQVLHQAQMDFHTLKLPLLSELHDLLKQLEAMKRKSWK